MRKSYLLLVLMLAVFLHGCVNFSNYQKAEVLEEGETRGTVGLSFVQASPGDQEIDYKNITYFTPEIYVRTGVTERFDFGVKFYVSLPVGVVIDGKYQFVDGEKFDMAADLGVGYTGISVADESIYFLDLYPALLMTYNFSENFSATLAPKVIFRNTGGTMNSGWVTLTGGTLTLALGEKGWVMPEVGYYTGKDTIDQRVDFVHWGVGFSF